MTRQEAEAQTILRCVVGSTVHGVNVSDGVDDRDEMGVCIEPIGEAMGVSAPFEQFIYRSAAEREGNANAPSRAGDLDLTIYSLRKYVRLALKGNPTVLTLLFAPMLQRDPRGLQLRELAPSIVSRLAGTAYLGYMEQQRQRLVGDRGQMRVNRLELIGRYGFDTKYAMHMLRLGMQGVELLNTGRLSFPMKEPDRSWLVGVRTGQVELQECLTRAGELEAEMRDLQTSSPLPEKPDTAAVDEWMTTVYFRTWSAARTVEDYVADVKSGGLEKSASLSKFAKGA